VAHVIRRPRIDIKYMSNQNARSKRLYPQLVIEPRTHRKKRLGRLQDALMHTIVTMGYPRSWSSGRRCHAPALSHTWTAALLEDVWPSPGAAYGQCIFSMKEHLLRKESTSCFQNRRRMRRTCSKLEAMSLVKRLPSDNMSASGCACSTKKETIRWQPKAQINLPHCGFITPYTLPSPWYAGSSIRHSTNCTKVLQMR